MKKTYKYHNITCFQEHIYKLNEANSDKETLVQIKNTLKFILSTKATHCCKSHLWSIAWTRTTVYIHSMVDCTLIMIGVRQKHFNEFCNLHFRVIRQNKTYYYKKQQDNNTIICLKFKNQNHILACFIHWLKISKSVNTGMSRCTWILKQDTFLGLLLLWGFQSSQDCLIKDIF